MSTTCVFALSCAVVMSQGLQRVSPPWWKTPARFGAQLGLLDDLDGDGWRDIVITAPDHDDGRGRLTVFSVRTGKALLDVRGRAHGESSCWIATCDGSERERLGEALWTDGDLDGDGWRDIVVSAYVPFDGRSQRAVRVISARNGAELCTVRVPALAPFENGRGNVWLADRDGDGCDEVCAYDPRSCSIVAARATANLRFATGSASPTRDGDLVVQTLVELARDIDGDGTDDLVYAETVKSEGRVRLTEAEMNTIDAWDPPDGVSILAQSGNFDRLVPTHAYRTVRETTRKLRIVSGSTGATLRELAVRVGESPEIVASCWSDLGTLVTTTRAFEREEGDETPEDRELRYDRDLDGDGVSETFIAWPWLDAVPLVSGASATARGPVEETRALRVFALPSDPPGSRRDPFALGRPSLNRAGRP